MTVSILSVGSPTSATTGEEICPAVVVKNDGTETTKVGIAWDGDPIDDLDSSGFIELGPGVAPAQVVLDLNGDGVVNVLDLTRAKLNLNSGLWTQATYDTWYHVYTYGTFPVRPSQGTIYPNSKLMPAESVNWTLDLLNYDASTGRFTKSSISKAVVITNSGGGGGGGGGGGTAAAEPGFFSRYWKWIVGGGAAIIGIAAIGLAVKKK